MKPSCDITVSMEHNGNLDIKLYLNLNIALSTIMVGTYINLDVQSSAGRIRGLLGLQTNYV